MPPRSITVVIVVFWLAMTAWLVQRDVWPWLAPGEPPPFAVYYTDDRQATQVRVRWTATHTLAGRPDQATRHSLETAGLNRPRAEPPDHVLEARLLPPLHEHALLQLYTVRRLTSIYRIDEEGRLLGFSAAVEAAAGPANPAGDLRGGFTGEIKGRVCELSWEWQGRGRPTSGKEQFEVSLIGNVLLPLHPVDRMTGLAPGRSWGAWVLDPLSNLAARPGRTRVRVTVRPQAETLTWKGQEKACWVVDYEDADGEVRGTTWVDTSEEKVLRMEVRLADQRWEIVRDERGL